MTDNVLQNSDAGGAVRVAFAKGYSSVVSYARAVHRCLWRFCNRTASILTAQKYTNLRHNLLQVRD
jgi:hypothetical protein